MIFSRNLFKICGVLVAFLTVFNIIFYMKKSQIVDVSPPVAPRIIEVNGNKKVSWEDVDFINYEKTRWGNNFCSNVNFYSFNCHIKKRARRAW